MIINNRKRSKRNKVMCITLLVILLIELGLILYFNLSTDFKVLKFSKEITINYKDKFDYKEDKVCYGNVFSCKKLKPMVTGKVDTSKTGSTTLRYEYKYKNKRKELDQVVKVVDEIPPEIKIEDKEVMVCPNGKILDFKLNIEDNYDGNITDKAKKEFIEDKVIVSVNDSNGNVSSKEVKAVVKDIVPPEITINSNPNITIPVGFNYDDEGATAIDNCDDNIEVKADNNLNNSVPGTYRISYTAEDKSGNKSTKDRNITVYAPETSNKIIYLTFDDGPSAYTSKLLDILAKYNVKATFFVTGNGDDNMILREYQEGHQVGLHTNTHDYSYLYSSVDNYYADLNAVRDRVKRITGYDSKLIRFPGGSSNTVSMSYDGGIGIMSYLSRDVQIKGFEYYDWNVSSGDAGGTYTSDGVYYNVINQLGTGSNVVLQHDVKGFSVDAVERIIQYGLNNGYVFRRLELTSHKAHHGIAN